MKTPSEISKRLKLLNSGDFRQLFIEELGWNNPDVSAIDTEVENERFRLEPVANFKGIRVWKCDSLPNARVRRALDRHASQVSEERLIVFSDGRVQEWQWPMSNNTQGRGRSRLVAHQHRVGRTTEALLQRLKMIEVKLDEPDPSLIEMLTRLRQALDAGKLTRAFYPKYSEEQQKLLEAIKGLQAGPDREWYSALLMNRLMFIYFLQRKGFMDGDQNYLSNRLKKVRELKGKDRFYGFYRDFLIPLFHEGLGSRSLSNAEPAVAKLIGDVPYVDGGIFSMHSLEMSGEIEIKDSVFESIFRIFDAFQWHLDDRPTGNPKEINPDVLGYIFEQFINNKEQGAYYTREDVTGFMSASSVVPAFLDRLCGLTGINIWQKAAQDPKRYVWTSLSYGVDEPYPSAIEKQRAFSSRPAWGKVAPASHALPGETWWEVDHRRNYYCALLDRLAAGDVKDLDSAVTANIDLETLAADVIDAIDSPVDIIACWQALSSLKIIDPTCGSGAFLFAALKILNTLYSAVLDAAEAHVSTSNSAELEAIVEAAARHPSREYFLLKHAALSNLYGVDLMREAVEIARLRLFLKLVAAVGDKNQLEPLPDLDFNIKAGNILVGAVTPESFGESTEGMFAYAGFEEVRETAKGIRSAYEAFREAQERGDDDAVRKNREDLNRDLARARRLFDKHFYQEAGAGMPFEQWLATHQPFHWFIEFPKVFDQGGFDVVIGNPPYVAKSKIKKYSYRGFVTNALADIYAPCTERATQILNERGRLSLILPISSQFGKDFAVLRSLLGERFGALWVSTFSRNPAALFDAGLGVRSTIIVGAVAGERGVSVTKTHRWYDDFRPALFETLVYYGLPREISQAGWIRLANPGLVELIQRLEPGTQSLGGRCIKRAGAAFGFKQICLYWISPFTDPPPAYTRGCKAAVQSEVAYMRFLSEDDRDVCFAVAASKIAFVWWSCTADDFHVTLDGLGSTPIDPTRLPDIVKTELIELGKKLRRRQRDHLLFTPYANKWMGNYVMSEMRDLTDQIDQVLARHMRYEELLPALEHAYFCAYKPTGDRPGTLRRDPCLARAGKPS